MHDSAATNCSTCVIWRVCSSSTAAVSIAVLVLAVCAAAGYENESIIDEGPSKCYSTAAAALDLCRNIVLTNSSTPSVYVSCTYPTTDL